MTTTILTSALFCYIEFGSMPQAATQYQSAAIADSRFPVAFDILQPFTGQALTGDSGRSVSFSQRFGAIIALMTGVASLFARQQKLAPWGL